MDVQAIANQLRTERPELLPSLQRMIRGQASSADLETVLNHLLQMQSAISHKRACAASLLMPRVGLFANGTQGLRHIPDVMIRTLCGIADIPHVTNATTEWLDMMESRNANR